MKQLRKWLRTIYQDVINGRYLDNYFAIAVAIVISVLNIFNVIEDSRIITTSILAVMAAVSMSVLQERRKTERSLMVSLHDEANVATICDYIQSNKIKRARLIQYSGHYVQQVIRQLLEKGVVVELLLQHPESIPQAQSLRSFQLTKMATFYQHSRVDLPNQHNLSLKYYREPPSIRGIKLDDKFISIGWYTYRPLSRSDKTPWLYGHNNAMINGELDQAENQALAVMFNEVFETLWENAVLSDEVSPTYFS